MPFGPHEDLGTRFRAPPTPFDLALLHVAAIALHVLFAAAWFGLAIALSILSKEAVRAESRGASIASQSLTKQMNGSAGAFYVFAILNFVLGLQVGAVYAWPYHAALALGLVLVATQFFLIRPSVDTMRKNLGTPVGRSARARLGMGLGIGHATWMAMWLLMYAHRTGV